MITHDTAPSPGRLGSGKSSKEAAILPRQSEVRECCASCRVPFKPRLAWRAGGTPLCVPCAAAGALRMTTWIYSRGLP